MEMKEAFLVMFMLAQLLSEVRIKEQLRAKDLNVGTTGTEAFPKNEPAPCTFLHYQSKLT